MVEDKILKNKSQAYGYKYASLSDIVKQGFAIPEMRIKPVFTPDGSTFVGNYIEWKDKDGNWNLGSPIVNPEDIDAGGQNICQKLGSSETYSRRYTALLALNLVCEDDKELEKKAPVANDKPATEKQLNMIRSLASKNGMSDMEIEAKLKVIKTQAQASKSIEKLMEK